MFAMQANLAAREAGNCKWSCVQPKFILMWRKILEMDKHISVSAVSCLYFLNKFILNQIQCAALTVIYCLSIAGTMSHLLTSSLMWYGPPWFLFDELLSLGN